MNEILDAGMDANEVLAERGIVSRRDFLRGFVSTVVGAGAFGLLPRVDGGYLAPAFGPTTAYAIEGESYFNLTVVGADEVGFHVVDVTDEDLTDDYTPVPRALVTVTSRYNQKSVSGETDDEGKLILSIADLAFPREEGDDYECNATIEVSTPKSRHKIRDFSIGKLILNGASGYIIGTHKYSSSDKVYLERASFDDWDILYTKSTFTRSRSNEIDHVILLRFKGITSGCTVSLTPYKYGTEDILFDPLTTRTTYDESSKVAIAQFKKPFLKTGGETCLAAKEVKLHVTVDYSGMTFSFDLRMNTLEAPLDMAEFGGKLLPFFNTAGNLGQISGEGNWPCFNGASISIVNWSFPIQYSFTPIAILISVGNDLHVLNDKGEVDKDFWKNNLNFHMIDTYTKKRDEQLDCIRSFSSSENKNEPYLDKNGQSTSHKFGGKFDVSIIAQVVAGFQFTSYSGEDPHIIKDFAFKAGLALGVDIGGTLLWQFMAGPVPMFATLSPELKIVFAILFSETKQIPLSKTSIALNDVKWTREGDVSLNIDLIINISVGAGSYNLLSLSVNACVTMPFFFGFLDPGVMDKKHPHVTIGVTFRLELALQALFFKLSVLVWSIKKTPFFDNWSGNDGYILEGGVYGEDVWSDASPRFLLTQPDGSKRHTIIVDQGGQFLMGVEDPFALMQIVSDDDMVATFEASAVRPAAELDYDKADLPTAHRDMIPKAVVLEDGSIGTELVPCLGVNTFTFSTVEGEEETMEAQGGEAADEADIEQDALVETDEYAEGDGPTEQESGESANPELLVSSDELAQGQDPIAPAADELTDLEGVSKDVNLDVMSEESDLSATAEESALVGTLIAEATGEESASDVVDEAEGNSGATGEPAEPESLQAAADDDTPWPGDPFLGFAEPVNAEYEYEPVAGKTTGAYCGEAGVQGIAEHGGIKPTVDVAIYEDVYSDPNQKIVTIGGIPYLFRVITVDYPMATSGTRVRRSRVVASAFDLTSRTWGNPIVIDYRSGNVDLPRIDIFDYDFDVVVKQQGSKWTQNAAACLVVTGGLRPDGDATTLYGAASNSTIAVVLIDANLQVVARSVNLVSDIYNDSKYHMVSCPSIRDGFAIQGASGALAFSYLHRSSTSQFNLMNTSATASYALGYAYVRDDQLSFSIATDKEITIDSSVTGMDMVLGDGVDGKYDALASIMLMRSDGFELYTAVIPPKGSFTDLVQRHNISSIETLPQVCPWPGHGTFLYTRNRPESTGGSDPTEFYLYEGSFDLETENAQGFTPNRVDTCGMKGGQFCVSPSGNFLFYYETFDGDAGQKEDPETGELVANNQQIYRMVAVRYLNGKFCEDFPFCEFDKPIDGFICSETSTEASVFLATEIVDFDKSVSRMRYISVPNTLAAEVTGFQETEDFVYAGKSCPFVVYVENHGNLIIGGFDVVLCDPDRANEEVDRVHVGEIKPDNILLTAASRNWIENLAAGGSEDNLQPAAEAPTLHLSAEEEKGMLMPGKNIAYKVSFKIPDNWKGEKRVLVALDDIWTPGISADGDLDYDPQSVVKYIEPGVGQSVSLHNDETTASLYDHEESSTKKKNNNNGGENLPKTADLSDLLTPMGLALGGLSSMLASYSIRRSEVEREELEEEGQDE